MELRERATPFRVELSLDGETHVRNPTALLAFLVAVGAIWLKE
jgi:hypothetical protein